MLLRTVKKRSVLNKVLLVVIGLSVTLLFMIATQGSRFAEYNKNLILYSLPPSVRVISAVLTVILLVILMILYSSKPFGEFHISDNTIDTNGISIRVKDILNYSLQYDSGKYSKVYNLKIFTSKDKFSILVVLDSEEKAQLLRKLGTAKYKPI